jgi:hypothetical protein
MEQAWVLTDQSYPLTAVSILNLDPGPPPDVLRVALDRLQALVPALRVTILPQRGGFRFKEASPCPPIPLEILERHDDRHWEELARVHLNQSIPSGQAPLIRASYLWSDSGRGDLVLAFHHAFADAAAFSSWTHQLLRYCVDPDDQPVREAYTFVPGSEALFPWEFRGWRILFRLPGFLLRQMRAEWSWRRANRQLPRRPLPSNPENGIEYISLDKQISDKLIQLTRKNGISIPGLITAAMLLAVRKQRYQDKPGAFRAITFAELRSYLRPPVAPQRPGCYLSMLRLMEYLPENADILDLGRRLSQQIYTAAKRGDRFLYAFLSKNLVQMTLRMGNQRLGATALSYAGPLPLQMQYGEFRLEHIHGYITNNPVGAEYTAFGKIWAGRMELDIQYLLEEMSPEEARKIAETIRDLLREAALSHSDAQ